MATFRSESLIQPPSNLDCPQAAHDLQSKGAPCIAGHDGHVLIMSLQVWGLTKPLGVAARNRPPPPGARKLILRPCNLRSLAGADFVGLAVCYPGDGPGMVYALTADGTVAVMQPSAREVEHTANIQVMLLFFSACQAPCTCDVQVLASAMSMAFF